MSQCLLFAIQTCHECPQYSKRHTEIILHNIELLHKKIEIKGIKAVGTI